LSKVRPQPVQRTSHRLPCSSMTRRDPALWCRRSTFWVMRVNDG
jgi:hypothetical protein